MLPNSLISVTGHKDAGWWYIYYELPRHTSTKFATHSHPSFNSMTLISNDPSWLPVINANRTISYFVVASFAGLIYDWILTFDQEVELIWGQRWSLMTVLYLSVRYLGMIYAVITIMGQVPTISVSDAVSHIVYLTHNWMSVVVDAILGAIIITRIHAMYQRSRKVLILLIVVFLFSHLLVVVMAAISTSNISGEELILSNTYQCDITFDGDVLLLYGIPWILTTVWEVLALCLALWIAIKHFREPRRQSAGGIIRDCFMVLMETHVGYFASFVVVSGSSLFLFFSPIFEDTSSLDAQIFDGFHAIFECVQMFVLGPRLILGVREYHAKLVADSDTATAMTSIAFQERVHVSTSSSV
ncbi:hypothetical protein DFH29DRAFT_192377 [Suillus ampliporus]|nr:hypothetical protein DFH29DRAFT_192377 [Suillus ampliporus]